MEIVLIRKVVPALFFAAVFAGCSDTAVDPPATLGITVEGRLERGSRIHLAASSLFSTSVAPVVWTADPAGAVEFTAGDSALLLKPGRVRLIATTPGGSGSLTVNVAVPPRIAFIRGPAGSRDVWTADLDGVNPIRLTSDVFDEEQSHSAGANVYFMSGRVAPAALFRVPRAGGTTERVTTDPQAFLGPRISPDETRLAFTRSVAGFPKLFVSAPTGTGAVRVVTAAEFAAGLEGGPAWSPDGRSLAFVSTAAGNSDIYTAEVGSAAAPRRLTNNAVTDVSPAWSTDGLRVAYVRGGSSSSQLLVYDLATSTERLILTLPGSIASPVWLADGRILYAFGSPSTSALFWIETVGAAPAPVPVPLDGGPVLSPSLVARN